MFLYRDLTIVFCVVLCLVAHPQHYRVKVESPGPVIPPCCPTVSEAKINQQVDTCYEQKETLAPCKIHAYM